MRIIRKHIPGESSPAIADFNERTITLNEPVFSRYDDFTRRFIINHERGHLALNTHSETAADEYAFNAIAGREPYSLRRSVLALQQSLPFTTPEHYARLNAQIRRSLAWDAEHGHAPAAAALAEMDAQERYARYYEGSSWEKYQKEHLQYLNQYALGKLDGSYSMGWSTWALLALFVAGAVLVAFSLNRKK